MMFSFPLWFSERMNWKRGRCPNPRFIKSSRGKGFLYDNRREEEAACPAQTRLVGITKKGGFTMTILEKVKLLEKYIAVDVSAVDPVMELAIEKLLKREASRLDELKQRLLKQKTEFAEKYA